MTLGQQIKEAREKKNLSQEELAAMVGVSRQAVSKWENGTAVPHGINRETLSQVLELTDLAEPPTYKTPWYAWLGWGLAALLLLGILTCAAVFLPTVLSIAKAPVQSGEVAIESLPVQTVREEKPYIDFIRFYNDEQEQVETDGGWYDIDEIDSILISYGGGTLNSVQAFCTPTGTEMTEYTELLFTRAVLDNAGVLLMSADALRSVPPTGHLYFSFDFGSEVVTTDTMNVFYSAE